MFGKIIRNKRIIDKEIELYKREKTLEIDRKIEDYRQKREVEMLDLAKRCHEELGKYEHDYHYTKEQKGIKLAELQAKIEALELSVKAREEVIAADNNLLNSKDAEIKRLNSLLELFINKQPQHTTTIQQLK